MHCPSCKEASMLLKFTADFFKNETMKGPGADYILWKSLHCWCYKLIVF